MMKDVRKEIKRLEIKYLEEEENDSDME